MEGVDYFEKYAPVVSWTTVRLMLSLIINQDWATRQVYFSNDFFQSALVEDIYVALPTYFESDTGEDRANIIMKLNTSLYALVHSPLCWYNHLKGDFEERGFKPSPLGQ